MVGVVTLSIEFELGWGVHDLDANDEHLSETGRPERHYLRKLLAACDESGVPLTFDVVGHLMLASCDGHHPGPYPEGWFDADPGSDVARDPLFYAPDAVEAIREAAVDHELCTHTFSHTPHDPVEPRAIAADLERAQEIHERVLGEPTRSFVPPRHRQPPTRVLREAGIDVVRVPVDDHADSTTGRAAQLLLGPPPMRPPEREDDVLWTYSTTHPNLVAPTLPSGQRPASPAFRALPTRLRRRLHRRYLERATRLAAENDAHLHLWSHLYDVSNEYQFPQIADYLETLGALEERGEIVLRTMAELAEREPPIPASASGD